MTDMTYAEFRKAHPAVRCFQTYSSETRANHAASRRVGRLKRDSFGEVYYTHPLVPDIAFPTAKAATERAFEIHCERTQIAEVCVWLEAV